MSQSIIILHGWGLRGKTYARLEEILKKNGYSVFAPDLPGFGDEPLPSPSFKLSDYVAFIDDLLKKQKFDKPIFIGHSFGGRVSIKYAFTYPEKTKKIILTGVPIIREISFKKKIAFIAATLGGKVMKQFPLSFHNFFRKALYYWIGDWDYYKSGPLKQLFVNIIGEDLVQYITQLKVPVVLVWGKRDAIVPVSILDKVKKLVPNAEVVIMPDANHSPLRDNPEEFYEAIKPFL